MLEMYARKLTSKVYEATDVVLNRSLGRRGVHGMILEDLAIAKAAMEVIECQNELIVKQAETIDDMNGKMDKLLDKVEKLEARLENKE